MENEFCSTLSCFVGKKCVEMLLIIELGDEVQNVRLNMYYVEEHLNLAARGGDVLIIKG